MADEPMVQISVPEQRVTFSPPFNSLLRPKITPTRTEDGGVNLVIEWVTVLLNNDIVKDAEGKIVVALREEVNIGPNRLGSSFISEVGMPEGNNAQAGLHPMFVDQNGLRHITAKLDPAVIPLTVKE